MNRTKSQKPATLTLKAWRHQRTFTCEEAADFLGISKSAYSRLELGQRFVKGTLAANIREKTKVPLEVLVGAN